MITIVSFLLGHIFIPMKDGPEEISGVLNLLLPRDELLPLDDKFKAEFFNTNKNGIMTIKSDKVDTLRDAIRGRISYLGELRGDMGKDFVGEKIGNLKHLIVQPLKMSDFQSKHYASAFQKDFVEKGIYSNSRQASLFVFPDGTYGTEGFDKYVIKKENRRLSDENKKFYIYSLSRALLEEFSQEKQGDKLNALQKFSVKYASTMRELIRAKRDGKNSFVYSEFVQGSGIILFTRLLELFGFSRAMGNEKTKATRYAIVTNQTTTIREIKNVIKRYNQPDNMNGDYISVIIGSEVIAEGYSLRNVQEEHILTPYWNYSETSQAISRGIRVGSHNDLINAGITPVLRIYQSVALPENVKAQSIDLKMYELSEIKDINIKHVERLIRKTSYDCALTYERNHVTGRDGERECDYTHCDYICDNVPSDTVPLTQLDNSTYHLYYGEKEVREIINDTVALFRNNFAMTLSEIMDTLKPKQYTMFNVLTAIEHIIAKNIRIYNKYGFVSYLREENNICFLTDNVTVQNRLLSEFYTRVPNIKATSKLFDDILKDVEAQNYTSMVEKIFGVESDGELLYLINRLSDEAKEILLEGCVSSLVRKSSDNAKIRDKILTLFKDNYEKIDGVYISTLLFKREGIIRCLRDNKWSDCTEEYTPHVEDIREKTTKKLETNEYGYYGMYNPKNDKFCIRDTSVAENVNIADKRKKKVGAVCETWKRPMLVRMAAIKFKMDPPSDFPTFNTKEIHDAIGRNRYAEEAMNECKDDKIDIEDMRRLLYWADVPRKDLCSMIRTWFEQRGLLVTSFDCGVQTKTR